MKDSKPYLTDQAKFSDVSRGKPKPHTLKGDDLVKARLTPETWRLEIIAEPSSKIEKSLKLEDKTALDFDGLLALGKKHAVKFLKAHQCNNIAQPLGQGLWEGVPLRDVLALAGAVSDVRRVYYWGFHNNDPAQVFQSSMGYEQIMETPPWDLTPLVAYKLNGQPISLERGGPVRMIVPWAHGFKSIKWLQRLVFTNNHQANDTYAGGNNAVDSYLKTAAYLDGVPAEFKADGPIEITGTTMVGISGLKRVEYWLRADQGNHGKLDDNDPAWKTATWKPASLLTPDEWGLPDGESMKDVWGFDPRTGTPKEWPLRFSVAPWKAVLTGLKPGNYEFRARTVDLNGYAQPEPRPYKKSGRNGIEVKAFRVV